jgi:hypothetical protein
LLPSFFLKLFFLFKEIIIIGFKELGGFEHKKMVSMEQSLLIKVPGKVILFGEHSVVYKGNSALACSLGIYTYSLLSPADNDQHINLNFPNVDLKLCWNLKDLESFLLKYEHSGILLGSFQTREISDLYTLNK